MLVSPHSLLRSLSQDLLDPMETIIYTFQVWVGGMPSSAAAPEASPSTTTQPPPTQENIHFTVLSSEGLLCAKKTPAINREKQNKLSAKAQELSSG